QNAENPQDSQQSDNAQEFREREEKAYEKRKNGHEIDNAHKTENIIFFVFNNHYPDEILDREKNGDDPFNINQKKMIAQIHFRHALHHNQNGAQNNQHQKGKVKNSSCRSICKINNSEKFAFPGRISGNKIVFSSRHQ